MSASQKRRDPRSISRSVASSATALRDPSSAATSTASVAPVVLPYDALVLQWVSTARLPVGDRLGLLKRLGATVNRLSQLTTGGGGVADSGLLTRIGSKIAELEDLQARDEAGVAAQLLTAPASGANGAAGDPMAELFDVHAKLEIVYGNRSESFLGQRAVADELRRQAASFAPFAPAEASTWRSGDDEHAICARTLFCSTADDPVFCIHDAMSFAADGDTRKMTLLQRHLLVAGTACDVAKDLKLHFGVTSILGE